MAPGLYLPKEFFNGEGSTDKEEEVSTGLDLSLSAMAFYPFPYLSTLDNNSTISSGFLSFSGSPKKNCKRLKRTPNSDESIGSNKSLCSNSAIHSNGMNRSESCTSLNSLPRPQFRDHVWTLNQRFLAAEALEEAAAAMMGKDDEDRDEEVNEDGIKLVHLLFSCAEAVACRDRSHASALLSELRTNAKIFGTSFQRVSSCFVQGLADRLQLVQPLGAVGIVAATENWMPYTEKKEEALNLVYEICPHIQFGHFVANASILEAFEGENFVHVVDLGMTLGLQHGNQWRALIDSLANRAVEPPRRLRITGVGHSVIHLEKQPDQLGCRYQAPTNSAFITIICSHVGFCLYM